ncbi:MAG: DNA-deoxyinosine glycosylase [Candidatus Omnitrophota bacterium]|nr:DNA-deoxyinosine glycosylase [Candidatus Omnitrophota bacterium]
MSKRLRGLPPVVDKRTEIIILGSMPGEMSLKKKQYYGHKGNHFWKIITDILGEKDTGVYAERIDLLKKHRIGLWDVIGSCLREGSRDDRILSPEVNDIPRMVSRAPGIRAILLNGRKAEELFNKNFSTSGLTVTALPSTSALNAISIDEKTEMWRNAIKE